MKNEISFILNGKEVSSGRDPMSRLLDVLREDFSLTGVKEGCGEGECGACAVLLDDKMVNSCLVPLTYVKDRRIDTIEGLRKNKIQKNIKMAFAEAGAVQCGFCTPGMTLAAFQLLSENIHPSETEAREAIAGNLCRCTGYQMIVDGILLAAEKLGNEDEE